MRELLEKFIELERRLAEEHGQFSLFALFLREDSTDKWDLVVAAPWIEENRKEGLAQISNRVQQTFAPEELSRLSRVVLIDDSNPALKAMHEALHCQHGTNEVRDSDFFGLQIKHAYIITSQRLDAPAEVPA